MAQLRREQIAAVNMHYRLFPFEHFLKTQQELGVKSIELCLKCAVALCCNSEDPPL